MDLTKKYKRFLNTTKGVFFLMLIVGVSVPILLSRTPNITDSLGDVSVFIIAAFCMFILPALLISLLDIIEFEQADHFDFSIIKKSLVPAVLYIIGFMILFVFFRYAVGALFSLLFENYDYMYLTGLSYLYHLLIIFVFMKFRN